jgi:hypothetical protein
MREPRRKTGTVSPATEGDGRDAGKFDLRREDPFKFLNFIDFYWEDKGLSKCFEEE